MIYRHKTDLKTAQFRAVDNENGEMRLEGYFIVYDVETEIVNRLFEKIERGAAADSLENVDIVCLFNHRTDMPLGRKSTGTFTLREDETGVWGSVLINPDDTEAVNVYHRVKRGEIWGCSFGFDPVEQVPEYRADGTHWTVKKMVVPEMSVCTFPAYEQTEIKARSRFAQEYEASTLSERKALLSSRLSRLAKNIFT